MTSKAKRISNSLVLSFLAGELGQNNCLVMSRTHPARTGMLSVWCLVLGCVALSQSTVADNAGTAAEGQMFKIVGTTPVWCVQSSSLTAHLSLPLTSDVLSFYPVNNYSTQRWCEWCRVLCAQPSISLHWATHHATVFARLPPPAFVVAIATDASARAAVATAHGFCGCCSTAL
jgi:hypothetical protein